MADPAKCSVEINTAKVGQEATVLIKTAYENGQPCLEPQEVSVELQPDRETDRGKVLKATVKVSSKRGEYQCVFTPKTRGWHQLNAVVNNHMIPYRSSPFHLYVDMPPSKLEDTDEKIELDLPYQAALMESNQIIVSQSSKISIYDGNSCTEFHTEGSPNGHHSTGIATGKDGSVFVAYDKPCIVKYDHQGKKVCETTNIKFGEHHLQRPGRIELSRDGTQLYVCDRGNERVVVFDSDLAPADVLDRYGQFADITFGEEDDYVYLSDKNKNVVLKYTGDGKLVAFNTYIKIMRVLIMSNGRLYAVIHNIHEPFTVILSLKRQLNLYLPC